MQPEEYPSRRAGQVVRSPAGYWAFVPNTLPPQIAYSLSLIRLLSEARGLLDELAGLGRMLPNPHLLVGPAIRREAVLSSRIEGTEAGLEELYLFEADPEEPPRRPDVREVHNYVTALEYGLQRIAFFEEHRDAYHRGLLRVSQHGEWERRIEFFLRGVREQSRDALRTARILIDLQAHYRALLQGRSLSKVTPDVLEHLFAQPVVTASMIRDRSKVNFRTAQKAIHDLEQADILREITGQRRSRIWVAREIMAILTGRRPLEGA
jgi:Fic family protein